MIADLATAARAVVDAPPLIAPPVWAMWGHLWGLDFGAREWTATCVSRPLTGEMLSEAERRWRERIFDP